MPSPPKEILQLFFGTKVFEMKESLLTMPATDTAERSMS
jgi:hypothetical protein